MRESSSNPVPAPLKTARRGTVKLGAALARCAACEIRDQTFCSALNDDELGRLQSIVAQFRVAPGQLLFQEGDEAGNVFNVLSGVVKLYKFLPDGRRQITGFLFAGDFLGVAAGGILSYSAEAVSDVVVCRFVRRQLYRLFDEFPKLESRLLGITTDELAAAQDQMLLLGRKTATEKIASFLINLARRMKIELEPNNTVPLPMPRADIADYLGLTVETVSRTLGKLAREGLIALPGVYRVTLLRPDDLQEIAEGF